MSGDDDNVLHLPGLASLPYGGETQPNSGHAGSDTSAERADRLDRTGETKRRQHDLLYHLSKAGRVGVTWKEYSKVTGLHHGATSGVLSNLHKEGLIARLSFHQRDRCKVYVLPQYVEDRTIDQPGQTKTTLLIEELATALRGFVPEGSGCPWHRAADPHDNCRFCVADQALAHYEARRKGK